MLFVTHSLFSIFSAILLTEFLIVRHRLLFISLAFIFSFLPDIDKPHSKISFFPVSNILNFMFGHRKIFHSLFFIFPIYILLSLFSQLLAFAFLVGTASHLLLDAMTKKGISPLYPFRLRLHGFIETNSILEKIMAISIAFLIILLLFS